MAKKNDRKEYNKLKKKKADNKKQQEQCQSEIDVLDEKIERLKAAYRKLDDAKEAIDDIKHNQRNMINSDLYQCMWTGSNAQECYDSCESGNLYTAYDGYVSNIDAAEDAINWEINTLKEKMNEKYGVLSGLVNACMVCSNFSRRACCLAYRSFLSAIRFLRSSAVRFIPLFWIDFIINVCFIVVCLYISSRKHIIRLHRMHNA